MLDVFTFCVCPPKLKVVRSIRIGHTTKTSYKINNLSRKNSTGLISFILNQSSCFWAFLRPFCNTFATHFDNCDCDECQDSGHPCAFDCEICEGCKESAAVRAEIEFESGEALGSR